MCVAARRLRCDVSIRPPPLASALLLGGRRAEGLVLPPLEVLAEGAVEDARGGDRLVALAEAMGVPVALVSPRLRLLAGGNTSLPS